MEDKQMKWLNYFKDYFKPTDEFINEMHIQLTKQYEEYFGRSLDWSKHFWLFTEPTGKKNVLKFYQDQQGRFVTELKYSSLDFNRYAIPTEIVWFLLESNEEIDPETYKGKEKIQFEVKKFELEEIMKNYIFSYKEPERKPLDYNFGYPVYCINGKGFVHEGVFEIDIYKKEDVYKLKEVFQKALTTWDRLEGYMEDRALQKERGLIHTLNFMRWSDEGKAMFYIDAGSAGDGVFEYIFRSIDESGIEIKCIELKGIQEYM